MTQTSAPSPAAVLDYAAPTPLSPVLRRLRAAILVLTCLLLGAIAGWIFDPRMYRAVGFLMVDATQITPAADEQVLNFDQLKARQAAAVAGVAGAANVQAIVSQLPSSMKLTAAEVTANLKVQTVPQSRLVTVSYEHPDPRVAAAVTNLAMGRYVTPGVNVAAVATPPAQPQRSRLYLLGGAAIGMLLGLLIVAMRWK
jgi:hypothetical protein